MMNIRPIVLLALGAVCTASLLGCSKSQKATPAESSLSATTRSNINEVLSAYEVVRAALANDESDVRAEALELASRARSGLGSVPEGLRRPLEELSGASQRLAELDGTDLRRARSAFGEVSRELIALLTAEPGLQNGLWIYDCPMAEGYSMWVQSDEKVSNPYMGSEMLQCGKVAEF
jgi:hypothetical protein